MNFIIKQDMTPCLIALQTSRAFSLISNDVSAFSANECGVKAYNNIYFQQIIG